MRSPTSLPTRCRSYYTGHHLPTVRLEICARCSAALKVPGRQGQPDGAGVLQIYQCAWPWARHMSSPSQRPLWLTLALTSPLLKLQRRYGILTTYSGHLQSLARLHPCWCLLQFPSQAPSYSMFWVAIILSTSHLPCWRQSAHGMPGTCTPLISFAFVPRREAMQHGLSDQEWSAAPPCSWSRTWRSASPGLT